MRKEWCFVVALVVVMAHNSRREVGIEKDILKIWLCFDFVSG